MRISSKSIATLFLTLALGLTILLNPFASLALGAWDLIPEDLDDFLEEGGVRVQTDDFGFNYSGQNDQLPGCNTNNCLLPPQADKYQGIAIHTEFTEGVLFWLNFFLGFLFLLAMVMLIYAGFLYVTSLGNNEQSDKAKKIVIYVVIGLILIIFAWVIVNELLGVSSEVEHFNEII